MNAINGTHEEQEYVDEVNRTLEWYKKRHTLYYVSDFKKEELEEMETIKLSAQISFGSQKVLYVLDAVCPHDYEAFPIEIETPTGISKKFFLINVCNRIENALDKENCLTYISKLLNPPNIIKPIIKRKEKVFSISLNEVLIFKYSCDFLYFSSSNVFLNSSGIDVEICRTLRISMMVSKR